MMDNGVNGETGPNVTKRVVLENRSGNEHARIHHQTPRVRIVKGLQRKLEAVTSKNAVSR